MGLQIDYKGGSLSIGRPKLNCRDDEFHTFMGVEESREVISSRGFSSDGSDEFSGCTKMARTESEHVSESHSVFLQKFTPESE
ncbi:hypothetical protein SLA2020_201530 [Shorea laevis]